MLADCESSVVAMIAEVNSTDGQAGVQQRLPVHLLDANSVIVTK